MTFKQPWVSGLGIGLILIVAIVFSPIVIHPAETPLKRVTVAYSAVSAVVLWFLLEKELGFFREEGLRPEFILVRGGGIALKGLIAGNFDYMHSTSVVMDAIIRGRQPFKIVFTAGMIHSWFMAQSEIRSITELKGKIVAISSLGSSSDLATREILKRHGLDPFKDATFLVLGSPTDRFAALSSGAIHATLLTHPFNIKAVEIGYRKLAIAADYVKLPAEGLGTREEKVLRDPQEVAKMVRASLKGLKFVLTQRDYVISKMMRMFHLSREEAVQTYQALRDESVPSGYVTEEGQRSAISLSKQVANVTDDIPPERVFDNRFVKQAEQELKGWKPHVPR
jgi:NitT/TauT family transport system substrate-binding protein